MNLFPERLRYLSLWLYQNKSSANACSLLLLKSRTSKLSKAARACRPIQNIKLFDKLISINEVYPRSYKKLSMIKLICQINTFQLPTVQFYYLSLCRYHKYIIIYRRSRYLEYLWLMKYESSISV